ncbi:hypothetical protein EDD15DRAFT_1065623 [Pisolithus albus]|nr:hypothetical protein EDD15DRAFT_1065623 [Pisolithus albus]
MHSVFLLVHWYGLLTRALHNNTPMRRLLLLDGQEMLNLDKNLGQGGNKDLLRHPPAPTLLPYDLYAAASATAAYSSGSIPHGVLA